MIKREYLTTTEAAELVGVTRQRIEALVRRGTLGDYRAYGRRVVCKGELYQWAKTRPAVEKFEGVRRAPNGTTEES